MEIRIRNAVKALPIKGDEVLLMQCCDPSGYAYFSLFGGGQDPMESQQEALQRELLEELGWRMHIGRLFAVIEEIYDDPALIERKPKSAHHLLHLYLCEPKDVPAQPPTQPDGDQVGVKWVKLADIPKTNLFPPALRDLLTLENIQSGEVFCRTTYIRDLHEPQKNRYITP